MFQLAKTFQKETIQNLNSVFAKYKFLPGKIGSRFSDQDVTEKNPFWIGIFVQDEDECQIGRIHFQSLNGETFKFSHTHKYGGDDPVWKTLDKMFS